MCNDCKNYSICKTYGGTCRKIRLTKVINSIGEKLKIRKAAVDKK